MPLDAESQALLAQRLAAGIPSASRQPLDEVRGSRRTWNAQTPVPKAPVDEILERDVPVEGGSIKVRIYRQSEPRPCPAVVYLHGGGWVLGDLDHSDPLCRRLAVETGFVVVNVDYRLAPEHRFPTAAEDSHAAFCWVASKAGELGIRPDRIAVAGASAGGNLACVVTLMARARGGPAPFAQVLAYPVLDDACMSSSYREFADGYIVTTRDMRWYWEQYLGTSDASDNVYACPLKASDLSGLPPALVITAECDPVRDDGERYAARLREAGVPVAQTRYPGTLHGFFNMPGALAKGTEAVLEAARFLRSAMEGRS